jgi:hypothetical protein
VPTTSPYTDLEPVMWSDLLARAAVFYATRTRLLELCDHVDRSGSVLLALLLDLQLCAREIATRNMDDEATVTTVVTEWDIELAAKLGHTHLDAASRDLLVDLRKLVRGTGWQDPFQQLFTRISALSSVVYGDAWRAPTLHVGHIGRPPREGRDPYAVTAVTPWPPDESGMRVHLHIHPERFGPAAFAALPMLLVHECVCHVAARQDRVANDSTFAEGLLDWVAYRYLEYWAVKLDRELAPAARWHAESLRVVLVGADNPEGWARRVGHQAAECLRAWFEAECDQDPLESPLTVAHLAVELNKVDRSLADKDVFVSLLGSPVSPDVEKALRGWESGRLTAAELLDDVVPGP